MNKNVSKFLNKFSKELVISVGNKPTSINTPFHFKTIWIRDLGASRGTILKNQMNFLITPAQAIGHKILDLKTSSRILRKSSNKEMMSFWRKLIIGNLACIKTRYSFEPKAKPFRWPKHKSHNRDTPKSFWLMPQGTLTKNCPFLRNTFEPYPFLCTKMTWTTLEPKDDSFSK